MRNVEKAGENHATALGDGTERWVTLRQGSSSVRGLLITPPELDSEKPLIFVHGGGWIGGSPEHFRAVACRIALQAKRPVLSVEYALAPQKPYPAAINDVVLACNALSSEDRLAGIIGGSAGAQIALAAMMKLRDLSSPIPRAAVFFNGAFAMSTDSETHRLYGNGSTTLTTDYMRECIAAYGVAQADDQRYGDLTLADLSGLSPLWIACGDHDPLLADSLTVYRRAVASGNSSRLQVIPGREHGFINNWSVDRRADDAISDAVDWLRGHIG